MDDALFHAIKDVILHPRTVDNHGLIHHLPVDLLEELERQFKRYCRKHGVKREKWMQKGKGAVCGNG